VLAGGCHWAVGGLEEKWKHRRFQYIWDMSFTHAILKIFFGSKMHPTQTQMPFKSD
jgi:hypothetical protein